MNISRVALTALALVLIIAGGYYGYRYVKFTPPDWLIKIVTQKEPPPPLPAGDVAPISIPQGFSATIFSRDVPGARVMTRDPKGVMLVSLTGSGKVVALPDADGDQEADRTVRVLEGLKQPHGIYVDCDDAGANCLLYVAETDVLKSYAYDPDTFSAEYTETLANFPSGAGHFTRTLQMAPDGGNLLISIGSSCNVCEETSPLRASVQSLDLATKQMSAIATGLRNTVLMALDPVQGEVWGTENGRDILGDDIPPDEVNILTGPTTGVGNPPNFGWPICYGKNVHDTDFDKRQYIQDPCTNKIPSHIDLPAHAAALGLAFIPEEGWPEEYRNDLLVAFHGSWNRSTPAGYKVVRIPLNNTRGAAGGPADFATGFLPAGSSDTDDAIGRPVGLMAEPGGVVYISDDRAGAIYRVAVTEIQM